MQATSSPLPSIGKIGLLGSGIMPGIAMGTISVMLPGISDRFYDGTNGVQISMVVTALGLGMLLGASLGGVLVDRIGRRPVLIGAAILFGLAGCGVLLLDQLWEVIGARFLVGLACGSVGVCIAAIIAEHFLGLDQSRWIGYTTAIATFANFILNPVAGYLSAWGWQYGFAIYVMSVPLLICIVLGIPARIPQLASIETPTGQVLRKRYRLPFSALALAIVIGTLSTGTSLYWPFRLREVGVTDPRELSFYVLPQILMIGLASLGYGFVRRFVSIHGMIVLCASISCGSLLVMGLAHNALVIMIGLAAEGCALGLLGPNLTLYALSVSPPEARGRVLGTVKACVYGSPFFVQFALDPINRIGGASYSLWALAVIAGSTAAVVGLGQMRERISTLSEEP